MKSATDYPTNTAIALLLAGDTGTGKSTFLLNWPKPWILDPERNLKGAVEYHRSLRPDLQFHWDSPDTDKDGKPLEERKQFDRAKELVREALASPDVGTICIDGFTRITEMLKEKLVWESGVEKPLIIGGKRQMSESLWQPFAQAVGDLVWDVKGKKPFIVTAHLKVDGNELTTVLEQKIDVQGRWGKTNTYPKCFGDYWQTMTMQVPVSDKYPRGVKYLIRTAPTNRNPSLKTSFVGLPADLEVGDAAFTKLLKRVSGEVGK